MSMYEMPKGHGQIGCSVAVPEREPAIQMVLRNVEKECTELSEALLLLEGRLRPICSQALVGSKSSEPGPPATCDMEGFLSQRWHEINDARLRIGCLLRQLEI